MAAAFGNGTKKFFNMGAAPSGWTRDTTTVSDHAIVITGIGILGGTTGGTTNFTSVHPGTAMTVTASSSPFSNPTSPATIDLPTHTHSGTVSLRAKQDFGTVETGYTWPYPAPGPTTPRRPTYYGFASAESAPSYDQNSWSEAAPNSVVNVGSLIIGNEYTIAAFGSTTQAQWDIITGSTESSTIPQYTYYYNRTVGQQFTAQNTGAGMGNGQVRPVASTSEHFHTTGVSAPFTSTGPKTFNLGVKYVDLILAIKNGAYGATWASQSATTVAKGGSVSITWNTPTVSVPTSSTLYWTIVNSGLTGALSSIAMSGSFVTTGATFGQTIVVTDNGVWDNGGAFIVQLRSDSVNGTIMAASQPITITEATNPTATFTSRPGSIYLTSGSVNEGVVGSFSFSTTRLRDGELLTYAVNNVTSSNADFSSATGSVVVTSNTGTFTITPIIDLLVESNPNENFTVSLSTRSGLLLATSVTIIVGDIPPTVTFITPPATINVNTAGTFTITTTDVPNGTRLNWSIDLISPTISTDFVSISGTVNIYNNTGTFYITPKSVYTGTSKTFTVAVKNSTNQTLQTSSSVTINPSTITFVTPITSLSEGQTITYNITTTNLINGSQLLWKVTPISPTVNADFNSVTGYTTIDNNTSSFSITPIANSSTVGTKTFSLDVYDFSGTKNLTITGITPAVTASIIDIFAGSTYNFITPPISILEGQSVTLQFISNVNSGTLYWTIDTTPTTAADFTGSVISGSITLNGTTIIDNTSLKQQYLQTFTITTAAVDMITESTETFTVSIRKVSVTGDVVATSNIISIIDNTESYYFINPSTYINEDTTTTYTVNAINTTITTLYWDIVNDTTAAGNFSGAVSGTITLTAGVGTFSITTVGGGVTGGDKSFILNLRTAIAPGTIVASVSPIVLVDTSKNPEYTFPLLPRVMSEGVTTTVNFQTTSVNPTSYYWEINDGSATILDFVSNSLTSSVNFNGSSSLVMDSNSVLAMETSDFTIECWIYLTTINVSQAIYDTRVPAPGTGELEGPGYGFYINSSNRLIFGTKNVNKLTGTTALARDRWYHVAVTRSNGTLYMFVDGLSQGSASVTNNFTYTRSRIGFGANGYFNGNISNLRIIKGTALYTSNFTISSTPVQLTNITNTVLLICTNMSMVDNSTFNLTLTYTGSYPRVYSTSTPPIIIENMFNHSGTFALSTGSFSLTPWLDRLTEGLESFRIVVRRYVDLITIGPLVAISDVILITDTSLTPTYTFDSPVTSVTEGISYSYTVRTTNVPIGSTLYWTINHLTTSTNDFSVSSGSFLNSTGNESSGSGIFNITILASELPERNETFTIQLRKNSDITTTVFAQTPTITLIDPTYPTYAFGVIPASINEGSAGTFNVTTTNIINGTTLYWTLATNAGDFSTINGSVIITNNTGSFSVTPTADLTTEGAEAFTVKIRIGSVIGDVVATSNTVTINDTSTSPPTYAFGVIPTSINEGSAGTFNVTTTDVANATILYWFVDTNTGDFSTINGSFTITSNTGSFSVTPTLDATTEGSETFIVKISTDNQFINVVATSLPVTINDTSTDPTYAFGVIPTSINEGSAGTFNVITTNVVNGTTLYWTIATNSGDFGDFKGSFIITSNTGSFTVTPTADITTEGNETFTVSIRKVSVTGDVVATSNTVTINDTSTDPTYAFGVIPTSINEGSAGTFNVTTTNVANATILFWTIATNSGDFSTINGSFTITSNTGSFSVTPTADLTTEGNETFTVSIRKVSVTGDVVATSNTVTINDTSITPPPTYAFGVIPASINEGSSGTFNVTTTNVANSTILYWFVYTNSGDFSTINGSFTITSNTGSFSVTPTADITTEGNETFIVKISTDSQFVNVVATSNNVTINDTSTSPTYAFGVIPTSINEGSAGTFNVTTTNVANSTTLYWTIATNSGDFSTINGSFTITSNTGSFSVTPTADLTTEGAETFTVSIRTVSVIGDVVATSNTVTINDTSTTPTPAYVSFIGVTDNLSLNWYISEGNYTATFTLTTTNVANGTTLYWTTYAYPGYAVSADDFTDGLLQGTVTVQNNQAVITRTAIADLTTEGTEFFMLEIRETSYTSTPVITSTSSSGINAVSIGDTSTSTPISSGLQLYLDAGKSSSYSGTGQTWKDLSGNGTDGLLHIGSSQLYTGPAFTSATDSSYFSFVSSEAKRVIFSGTPAYQTPIQSASTAFTWSIWVYPVTNSDSSLLMGYRAVGSTFYKLTTQKFEMSPAEIYYMFTLNTWQNITAVYDGSQSGTANMKLYVNGIQVGVRDADQPTFRTTAMPFYVGGDAIANEYASARINQVAVYNRALSAEEVTTNFNRFKKRFGL